MKEQDKSFNG